MRCDDLVLETDLVHQLGVEREPLVQDGGYGFV